MKHMFIVANVVLVLCCCVGYAAQDTDKLVSNAKMIFEEEIDGNLDQPFDTIDGILSADLIPTERPVDRELPWYLSAVQRPATSLLVHCCNMWDWVRTRARRFLPISSKCDLKECDALHTQA